MPDSPNLILPYIQASQAQKHITHNEAIKLLDGVVQLGVLSRIVAAPPGSPVDGDRYIVASGATGLWAGWDLNVAFYVDGAWVRLIPRVGWTAYSVADAAFYVWTGAAWTNFGAGPNFLDTTFRILDDADPTKIAAFDASGISTGTTRTYSLPNTSSTLAVLAATQTFSGTTTFSGTFTVSAATASLGTSTGTSTANVGTGATLTATTKTVNLGTAGLSGSTTVVNIGSAVAGALGSLVINSPTVTFASSVSAIAMAAANVSAKWLGLGGATADSFNRFSINTPSLLLNNAGAGIDMTFNKNAAGDDATMSFKTGFSARAIFGLAGSDDTTLKVSPDGSSFFDAFSVLRTSGAVTFGNQANLPMLESPANPGANKVALFGRKIAGRIMPAYLAPSGLDSALQPLLARNKVGYWNPPGNATTNPGVFGFTAPTVTGFTATARNVATTNKFTRFRRLGYVTAATAGAVGQWRVNNKQYTLGDGAGVGGFTYIIRFGISDPATVSDARMFMGFNNSGAPTNIEPSTFVNCIGVGHGAADTNLKIFYGGSAAQTPIDLGASFPITPGSEEMYELALFASPNSTDCIYEVTRLSTGDMATGTLSGTPGVEVPSSTTLIGPWGFRTNNASAAVVAIDVASAYIETDY